MPRPPSPTSVRLLLASLLPACAVAQEQAPQPPFEYLPGTRYEAAIPTPEQVLGHGTGEELSLHADVMRYLEALVKASPRARLVPYGTSVQGRSLQYLVVASEQNLARLEQIKAAMHKLADPRRLAAGEETALMSDLPAVAWLAYCVHGDEPSGSDACLQLAWHLLAAQGDEVVEAVLRECVVVLDPMQNPDGRDRFVHSTRAGRGRWADPEPLSAEHTQPWPGGRVHHNLFDMNRDWFAMTQPETQARVRAFLDWWPLVYVDLHEMGGNSTYYFAPPAEPLNPEITGPQRQWLELYGRNNGRWFDRFGFDYFTREAFDAFYPGYGEGWPTFHGSIGMTFEMASSRGLVFRRDDDSLLHYRQCVQRHFVASLGTLDTLSRGRADALAAFLAYRRSALEEGSTGPVREYVFPPRGDRTRLARLMELLLQNGIEVRLASAELQNVRARPLRGGEAGAQTFPAGTFVVPMAQPAKRLCSVLLAPHFEMNKEFLEKQQRREQRRQDLEFYDITGWSLPLLFDVETWVAEAESTGATAVLQPGGAAASAPGRAPETPPAVAYVVAWGQNGAAALLASLLRTGVKVRCMDRAFRLAGTDFPPGSFVVRVHDQPADLHARMQAGAQKHAVTVHGTDTSWVESGIHFGSNNTHVLKAPKVALAWDRPASANSAGCARFLLEQRYGLPVTPLRTQDLARAELERYTVLVLPHGGDYAQVLGKSGAEAIRRFVDRGGVLVTLGSATRWLTSDDVKLLATQPEDRKKPGKPAGGEAQPDKPGPDKPETGKPEVGKPEGEKPAEQPAAGQEPKKDEKPEEPFDYQKAIQPDKEPPAPTPGAILRVSVDPEHWLGFGYDGDAQVVTESSVIYTPLKLDRGTNVAIYAPEPELLLSGFVFESTKKQLAQKAWLVHQPHGRGHVVAFAEDPNLRCFADGMNLFFLNAVLLAAGR